MFRIEFETTSVAFDPDPILEISRILSVVNSQLRLGRLDSPVLDINGTTIGRYEYTHTPDAEIEMLDDDGNPDDTCPAVVLPVGSHCDDRDENCAGSVYHWTTQPANMTYQVCAAHIEADEYCRVKRG